MGRLGGQTDILQVMGRRKLASGHEEADYGATKSAIEAVWRIESPRLIAGLARITGDVGAAEELAQDALVIALEQWPVQRRPGRARRLADGDGEAPRRSTWSAAARGTSRNCRK